MAGASTLMWLSVALVAAVALRRAVRLLRAIAPGRVEVSPAGLDVRVVLPTIATEPVRQQLHIPLAEVVDVRLGVDPLVAESINERMPGPIVADDYGTFHSPFGPVLVAYADPDRAVTIVTSCEPRWILVQVDDPAAIVARVGAALSHR